MFKRTYFDGHERGAACKRGMRANENYVKAKERRKEKKTGGSILRKPSSAARLAQLDRREKSGSHAEHEKKHRRLSIILIHLTCFSRFSVSVFPSLAGERSGFAQMAAQRVLRALSGCF